MNWSLEDLGLAYRKAKVDLYYSSYARLREIADYESSLSARLQALLEKINSDDETWVSDPVFLGGWTLAPKSINLQKDGERENPSDKGLKFSSPDEEWLHNSEQAREHGIKVANAEFRLMSSASIDFHVLSTLWILKVGHYYDAKLADCAYGNRLRRSQDKQINLLSLGSFKPYLKPFRDWRDDGIRAMKDALGNGKKIVALTADVSGFYHELNPSFMLDDEYNDLAGVTLEPKEQKLHRLFVGALQAWANQTPLKKGLPVGLPASAVVANAAMIELDRVIQQQLSPLYYGRYVDDVLLVMENSASFRSMSKLWGWIFARSQGLLGWAPGKNDKIQFKPAYLSDSDIAFDNDKNKVFLLTGETGETLINCLIRQIQERASEWRALPNLPTSPGDIGTDLVTATQSDGEVADNLRKADTMTMRRAAFAINLRDLEAYERDLPPDAWKAHRHAFFRAFMQHVLVPSTYFTLALYVPRVLKLATACGDFDYLSQMIRRLRDISRTIEENCTVSIKSCDEKFLPNSPAILDRWRRQLEESISESVTAAFPPRLTRAGMQSWIKNMAANDSIIGLVPVKAIQEKQAQWYSYDLAHMPLRFIGFPRELTAQRGIPTKRTVELFDNPLLLLPISIVEGAQIIARWTSFSKGIPHGYIFATRPFSLSELFLLARDPFGASQSDIQKVVLALRGFTVIDQMPAFDRKNILQVPTEGSSGKQAVAVSSWKTDIESWTASVSRRDDPHALDRYIRLTRLVSGVISNHYGARYFILPELSVPAHWFMRFAQKLQGKRISMIAGIEYLHARRKKVRHQVWVALTHDGLGFPSTMVYRQDKQRPALHEEQELQRVAGLEMEPDRKWREPPVIQHGEFRFALLVCSELTNIRYRAALRGSVDALFIPEWNPDTETFNALVESAALDTHAYIVQCNDRQYGDSRIRAPGKQSWQRDVLRVKGG